MMKTYAPREAARVGRSAPAITALGTAGWARSQADRERVRSALRPPVQRSRMLDGGGSDRFEQEADRVADQVVSGPAGAAPLAVSSVAVSSSGPRVQRTCAACGDEEMVQRASLEGAPASAAGDHIDQVRARGGAPLPGQTRAFMQDRFGHDFSHVRVHSGAEAVRSTAALSARAYTVGRDIVFGAGQYAPETLPGRRLLAHELTHVVQQGASAQGVVQRQPLEGGPPPDFGEVEMGRKKNPPGWKPPTGTTCSVPSYCPPAFCTPYTNLNLAQYHLAKNSPLLLAGIAAAVGTKVLPVWRDYLSGGTAPQNFTSQFGADFAASPETDRVTKFLVDELRKKLTASPPVVAPGGTTAIDIPKTIPGPAGDLGNAASANQMNFSAPRDVAGNLAGGIGADETACPVGAKPSPFNDERRVSGTATVTRTASGDLLVTPSLKYVVQDTVDLCPGDCGAPLEQIATVPFSQWEATGIAGDVPFTVEFAPKTPPAAFTIPAPKPPGPAPAPSPKAPGVP